MLQNALWTALQTIFRPKMHYIARFCIHNLKFFGVIPLEPCRGRGDPSRTHPSPWCLVPDTHFHLARQRSIVPVLRNDHWLEQHKCETGNIIRLIYVSLEIVEVRCAERKTRVNNRCTLSADRQSATRLHQISRSAYQLDASSWTTCTCASNTDTQITKV